MKLIVGLGNPGKKYEKNRHNFGFMVADALTTDEGLTWKKDQDLMCRFAKKRKLAVIKPTIFMNRSGESVKAFAAYYKIGPENILVICDDIDLEFGKIRLAFGGTSAGHKGIDSVIGSLAIEEFARLRIGIGRPSPKASDGKPSNIGVENFVLADFLPEEKEKLKSIIGRAVEAVRSFIDDGIDATMNRFN
ncbi:MAG: aminoacyl-tRNA hydrolase [Candidatus Curtissbacteria bacterium]|nr:aminoacyl-tRNA hydrolase [Candidatus Curtissbacteria bacterium]